MKNRVAKICSITALVMGIMQVVVVLLSWLINSANGSTTAVRSLLSAEGIRWYFGHFSDNLSMPYLVWLLLLAMAYGSIRSSGVFYAFYSFFFKKKTLMFRERIALYFVFIELIMAIVVVCLLTIIPHAILLSVSGNLFPSSFSQSLIPVISFVFILISLSFGLMSGNMHGLVAILDSMTWGIYEVRYLILLYVIFVQLFFSVLFVCGY